MGELVHYGVEDAVARIVLDSPHNRNALSSQLQLELNRHVHEALDDDAVRVVLLTGAGPVFCSGADLKEHREGAMTAGPEVMVDTLTLLWESPKPVVTRMNGPARAGGLGLVGSSDIVVAGRSVTFGFAEVCIGVLPAVIGVTCLPRMTPRGALEVFLTGANFSADRAVELGLITRAVEDSDLDAEVDRYVDLLLRAAPGALAGIKPMIRAIERQEMSAAFEEMIELSLSRFRSEEAREGITAFAEKRDPSWVVSR